MTTNDTSTDLSLWVGLAEQRTDVIDPFRVQALDAVLDHPPQGGAEMELPPAWHWLCFLPLHRQSDSGPDGHPARGGFLPPVALPRRMWAGSRLHFHAPVVVGSTIQRRCVIESVQAKSGRSGDLVFVTVRHEISARGALAITEWQDIVYRGEPAAKGAAAAPASAPVDAESTFTWSRTLVPNEALLFRFSALTFNAHRIHYDRPYATSVEGYPDLVVHGPLQAVLLLDLLRQQLPGDRLLEFRFRGVSPAFCGQALTLGAIRRGRNVALVARNEAGQTTMEASAILAD